MLSDSLLSLENGFAGRVSGTGFIARTCFAATVVGSLLTTAEAFTLITVLVALLAFRFSAVFDEAGGTAVAIALRAFSAGVSLSTLLLSSSLPRRVVQRGGTAASLSLLSLEGGAGTDGRLETFLLAEFTVTSSASLLFPPILLEPVGAVGLVLLVALTAIVTGMEAAVGAGTEETEAAAAATAAALDSFFSCLLLLVPGVKLGDAIGISDDSVTPVIALVVEGLATDFAALASFFSCVLLFVVSDEVILTSCADIAGVATMVRSFKSLALFPPFISCTISP